MLLTGNSILITGGTSGIGRGLAEELHRLGNRVVIAGRRQRLLDEITAGNPGLRGLRVDLSDAAATNMFSAQVREEIPDLNVLINNAGISRTEDLAAEVPDASIAEVILRTNVASVLQLTTALLPTLRRQPHAAVITTSSGLAFVPRANYPTYCASKAFLHSWLQSLRHQLRDTSVRVLELAPPYVQTELAGSAQAHDPAAMPLADYIAEVMQLLAEPEPPRGEILVGRVQALRSAERDSRYDATFAALNPS